MRLIEERRASAIISYVYEPGSYVPLARLDADGEKTEQGGLGTTEDADLETAKTIAASADQTGAGGQNHSKPAANDAESRYWASLNAAAQERAQTLQIEDWDNGTTGQVTGTTGQAELCKVYYFHTDQVGMPQELSNSQGQLVWQASYKTWGSTVAEEWEIKSLSGNAVHRLDQGDRPDKADQQQNLRFQGQYLDRETGLHYNTFRYYDADIGRFISPDPIGLEGGINLGSYSPNPVGWIDPLGLLNEGETAGYGSPKHRGDGLEAHEILRNKKVQDEGIGSGKRVNGNPSIALDPKNHKAVHAEENALRKARGLGVNDMLKTGRAEIRLMSRAIYNTLVRDKKISIEQLRTARRMATTWAKSKGCY